MTGNQAEEQTMSDEPTTSGVPTPPQNLMFMDPSFEKGLANGRSLLEFVQHRGFLNLEGSVLDVGCGYGRSAYALLELGFGGQYLGFDILPRHIAWLSENLSAAPSPAHLEFRHFDVHNGRYNPNGKLKATQVALPAASTAPDLILAFSVFTHMYADEITHYLSELATQMNEGSIFCATFFLMNASWQECEAAGSSAYPMQFELGEDCRYFNEEDPLHAIAYREEWVLAACAEAGLELADDIHLGGWCGRGRQQSCYQDTLFLRLARS